MDINDNNYQVIFTKQSEREMKSIYQYISKTLYILTLATISEVFNTSIFYINLSMSL